MNKDQMSNAEMCTPFYGESWDYEEKSRNDEEAAAWIEENGIPEDDELPF